MSSIDASMIECTLSSPSWKVASDGGSLLEKCLVLGDPDGCCSNLQDLISLDNCILLERRDDDEGRSSCQLTVSLKGGEEDNWRFGGFSLLTSAKYVELHTKQSREYVASLKGQLVDLVDDMVMIQFDHRLYPRPECFHLTLIPKESGTQKIWIYGLLLKVSKYLGAPLKQASSSSDSKEKKDNSNDFFINMMCQMMSKKMDIRKK